MKEVLFRSDTSPKKGRTPLLFFRKSTKSSFGDEGGAGHFVRLLSWELTSAKELCVLFRLICVRRPEPPPPYLMSSSAFLSLMSSFPISFRGIHLSVWGG